MKIRRFRVIFAKELTKRTETGVAQLPRGIQLVRWTNAEGKAVRYRVRIKRKAFKADKLFDTLDEAREFLAGTKSEAGRRALDEEERARRAWAEEEHRRTHALDLRTYMRLWEGENLPPEGAEAGMGHAERKRVRNERSRIRTVCGVEVEYNLAHRAGTRGFFAAAAVWPSVPFGDLKLAEITPRTAQSYIEGRRKGAGGKPVSYATIKRDLAFLSVFFKWLRVRYPDTADELPADPFDDEGVRQVFRKHSVKKEAGATRDAAFADYGPDAEDRLFAELRKCRNPQMLQIVALALATGQRRGEILSLTWDRVFEDRIVLRPEDTKTGKGRSVFLSDEAKRVVSTIERTEGGRVFKYTPDGFKSVWDRVRKRAGCDTLRFHDLRHIFIARLIEEVASPVAVASVAGFRSVAHVERAHIQPARDRKETADGIRTERGLRLSVGHSDARMTAHYAGDVAERVVGKVGERRREASAKPPAAALADQMAAALERGDMDTFERIEKALERLEKIAGRA